MWSLNSKLFRRTLFALELVFVTILPLTAALLTDIDRARYDEGRKQFELVQQNSQMPKYGQCWMNAMMITQSGCRRLNDVVQTRLALSYLNCFLQIQGKAVYPCSEELELETCVSNMNDADRGSFATFFAHTQDICYFLEAQIWQEHTENTINRLEASSSQVAEQMESSHRLQQDIISSQNQSLQNQEKLMNQAQNLSNTINKSSSNVISLFEDLKKSTQEQRQIIGNLFTQLSELQSTIFGEISGFYSLFLYVMSLLICYLLTSVSRTSGARFWLFLIMTINVVTEQTIMRWISSSSYLFDTGEGGHQELLYWLQRQCRRIFGFFSLLVLAICTYMYKDINAVNNQLLIEIRKQNSDIKRCFTADWKSVVGLKEDVKTDRRQEVESTDSDYTSDNNDNNNTDDDSDKTFVLSENHDTDTDNVQSLHNGEESESDTTSLLGELYDLKKDLPETESGHHHIESWLNRSYGREEFETTETPVSGGSPYNLRPRRSGQGGNISPAAQVESARSFSRTVHQMQQITEKNSRLIRAIQQHSRQSNGMAGSNHLTPSPSGMWHNSVNLRPHYIDHTDRSSILTRSSRTSSRKL